MYIYYILYCVFYLSQTMLIDYENPEKCQISE